MTKNDHLTLGDEIKKKYYYELYPYNLRAQLSARNLVLVNHFNEILSKFWEKTKKNDDKMHGIFFNKVISELIRLNPKLNFVTYGWYLYGIEIVKPTVDQSTFIPTIADINRETGFSRKYIEELDKQIVSIANKFDPNKDKLAWERMQYENFGEKIYLTKLDLQEAIRKNEIKMVNKKLSMLYIHLKTKKFEVPIGALTLMNYIDIAKKVIITNGYKLPSKRRFNEAFDQSWRCFAVVNLYLTCSGDDAEKIKLNASKRAEEYSSNAMKTTEALLDDIKLNSKFDIKMDNNSSEILSSIHKILQDG